MAYLHLIDGITGQLDEVMYNVGQTPASFNVTVNNFIQNVHTDVILPIGGLVLAYVVCMELISIVLEKNNLVDFEIASLWKWMFKSAIAVFILSNSWVIVSSIFDIGERVIGEIANVATDSSDFDPGAFFWLLMGTEHEPDDALLRAIAAVFADSRPEGEVPGASIGQLLTLLPHVIIGQIGMAVMGIIVTVVVWGRMIEIYLMMSLSPIPLATLANNELKGVGLNYFKAMLALAFQGALIILCVGIYRAVIVGHAMTPPDEVQGAVWQMLGFTVLLCWALMQTSRLSKSIFNC